MDKKLKELYQAERERLVELADTATLQGEYLRPVFGEGNAENPVVFIGEAPGKTETEMGHPFVGKAGKQLDDLLRLACIPRESVFITNTVKYRPCVRSEKSVRNRTPSTGEIMTALPLLKEELLLLRPRLVVTLGNTPLKAISALAGKSQGSIGELHGRVVPFEIDGTCVFVYPCYHPASGIYNRSLIAVMEEDACRLKNLLNTEN